MLVIVALVVRSNIIDGVASNSSEERKKGRLQFRQSEESLTGKQSAK